jgi:hypothetical protein
MTYRDRSNQTKLGYADQTRMPKWVFKLASFCRDRLNSAPDRIFDRLLGVSTRESVVKDSFLVIEGNSVFNGRDNCPYDGSQWFPVRSALKHLAPGPTDVLVDFGSGKGKVLLVAGRLPFRRVVGVEIDENLSECAKRNIKRARPRLRAHHVDCINASVLDWPIPDETSVVFMFNPFIGETFHSVVGRVIESYDRRPRTLHIVYSYPWEHDWLLSTGRVVVDDVRPGNWLVRPRWWKNGYVIISYRVVGISEVSQSDASPHSLIRSRKAIRYWSRSNGHSFTVSAPGLGTIRSRS